MSLMFLSLLGCGQPEPGKVLSAAGRGSAPTKLEAAGDTGWWAPVPTYDCPEPERTPDVLVEQSGGYGTVRWWDDNVVAWQAYTEFELDLANYLSRCDAGSSSSVVDHGAGAAEIQMRFLVDNREPAGFVGLHNPEDDGISLYVYVSYTLDGVDRSADIYSSYGPDVEDFDASVCIGRFTPDRLAGSTTFEVDNAGETLLFHVVFDLQRDDSPYWKEHGDAPCLNVYRFAPNEDLAWSGVWP